MIKRIIKKKAKRAALELALEFIELLRHAKIGVTKDSVTIKFKGKF